MLLVTLFVCAVFLLLSLLHVYWAFGGRWAASAVLPEEEGARAFTPSPAMTLGVAGLLLAAAAVMLLRGALASLVQDTMLWGLVTLGTWVLAGVFGVRAVGEFRQVGFFKRVRGTRFATWDTWLYSPLCAALSAACAFLANGSP
ncbi:DUF3995 domain-containing protein [Archangium lipolyticum]|uniref:DUF3995 domain-containing protein n=1 Tax=Archangium lipolyticum TaxID=2970465 RepID=UPI00214A7CE2|nr:DUF3995 domain-containing protein [Archangium lipolyticum]